MAKKIRITQVRSGFGLNQRQEGTLKALGLRRIRDVVEKTDSPAMRGLLRTVGHLVRAEEAGKA